jgi:hypothetical protein
MKAHVEMIRTSPDEEFLVPENGRVVHVDHTEQGLYVYFYVPHTTTPVVSTHKAKGWRA